MQSSAENSVCPSVKGVNCDKTEEKSNLKKWYNFIVINGRRRSAVVCKKMTVGTVTESATL